WARHFSTTGVTLKAIAGTGISQAAAVGVSGNTGVLVELSPGSTTPKVSLFPSIEPRAIWFDGTHGMAVGYGNDVLLRQSGTWSAVYSPSFETPLSVVGDGLGGVVTVGDRGSIYRYDPATKTWNSLFQTQLAVLQTAAMLV